MWLAQSKNNHRPLVLWRNHTRIFSLKCMFSLWFGCLPFTTAKFVNRNLADVVWWGLWRLSNYVLTWMLKRQRVNLYVFYLSLMFFLMTTILYFLSHSEMQSKLVYHALGRTVLFAKYEMFCVCALFCDIFWYVWAQFSTLKTLHCLLSIHMLTNCTVCFRFLM